MRVAVIAERDSFSAVVIERLRAVASVASCHHAEPGPDLPQSLARHTVDTVVWSPVRTGVDRLAPQLDRAERELDAIADARISRLVLLSSALVNPPSHRHPGMVNEARLTGRAQEGTVAGLWRRLEAMVHARFESRTLTVLRPVPAPIAGERSLFARLLSGGVAATVAGHDPSIQLLCPQDLAAAIAAAVAQSTGGVYNVAPDGAMPLHAALRQAGAHRLPVPRWLHRTVRAVLAPLGLVSPAGPIEYLRYPWTVSNAKVKRELGFEPTRSTAEAVAHLNRSWSGGPVAETAFDPFGMDTAYIERYLRTLYQFAYRYYWRVDVDGVEQVPANGAAVLAGVHRGFMPYDGVIALKALADRIGRYPRFLVHPSLTKFPFLSTFMTRFGGVLACQENADWVMGQDEIVGIYPEGINGAFTPYARAYRVRRFGSDGFVRIALRHRAPIVPFVTVGNAEIFPILAKVHWNWWTRFTEWPCFPIAPPFPLVPLPLPSKWHIQFLAPIPVGERHPPEAADDPEVVRAVSDEVRARMQEALDRLLARRRNRFFGSLRA